MSERRALRYMQARGSEQVEVAKYVRRDDINRPFDIMDIIIELDPNDHGNATMFAISGCHSSSEARVELL